MLAKRKQPKKNKIWTFGQKNLKSTATQSLKFVSNRNNTHSKYYDNTNKPYKDMVEFNWWWCSKGKIDYYIQIYWTFKVLRNSNVRVTIKTYEDFTVHYTDSHQIKPQYKTHTLKRRQVMWLQAVKQKNHRRSSWKKIFQINFGDSCLLTLTACSQSTSSKSFCKEETKQTQTKKKKSSKERPSAKDTSKETGKEESSLPALSAEFVDEDVIAF